MKRIRCCDEGQPSRWSRYYDEKLRALGMTDGLPFAWLPVTRFGRRWWFTRVPRYLITHELNLDAPGQYGRVVVTFHDDADYDAYQATVGGWR